MAPSATRVLHPGAPFDLARTLLPFRRGGVDPCMRVRPGECWRATRTPAGPATVHLHHRSDVVEVEAWGPGRVWALEQSSALIGVHDGGQGFEPRLPLLADLTRRFPGMRMGRTNAVAEALAPTIVEQKVTSHDAHSAWARLVHRLGEPAPGPAGLFVPPAPATLATTPSWVFHQANIERRRADTIRRTMARAARLEEITIMPMAEAYRRLEAFAGVGSWSAAEVALVALGDADAVSVGDWHLKHQVSWALAGEPRGTDERMLELLEPWRGHRARVVRLLAAGGTHAPRFGPRLAHRSIAAF